MQCLLPFDAEYFVAQCAVHKYKGRKIYTTVTLPVVLYRREIWTLTLREKRWFRVFDNTLLRIYFGLRGAG
jgi:hypothetical protein